MWNRCVRGMFQLPYATHTRFLPFIMCISSATYQIYGMLLKLCQVMEHSENDRVNYVTHLCMSLARSIIGSNLRIVGKRLHVDDKRKLLDEGIQLLRQAYINECTEEDYMSLSLKQELRGYISGTQRIESFIKKEIQEILEFNCTE